MDVIGLLLLLIGSTAVFSVSVPADIIDLLQDPKRYNRHASPTQFLGSNSFFCHLFIGVCLLLKRLYTLDVPTVVSIQMYIEGISSFRAQTMVDGL